jgi:hypothetical protein
MTLTIPQLDLVNFGEGGAIEQPTDPGKRPKFFGVLVSLIFDVAFRT